MISHPGDRHRTEQHTAGGLETILILIKVSVVLLGWLAVFLMTFLGYLTLPAIVLFGFLIVYTTTDLLGRRLRKLKNRK